VREVEKAEIHPILGPIEVELELLERHVNILRTVIEMEPIGIISISDTLGYPQHKVRYSLRLLEQEGLIRPSPKGAVSTKQVAPFLKEVVKLLDKMKKYLGSIQSSINRLAAAVQES